MKGKEGIRRAWEKMDMFGDGVKDFSNSQVANSRLRLEDLSLMSDNI